MKKQIGLWIDHQKAILVILDNDKQEVRRIQSKLDRHVHFENEANARTVERPEYYTRETRMDRRFHDHLQKYYQQVISAVSGAEKLLVFGNGEAKYEFEKQLKKNHRRVPRLHVESADKMTERQITAKVRKYFEQ
jgi:hypothetical protein